MDRLSEYSDQIKEMQEFLRVSEAKARFILALELGLIDGDIREERSTDEGEDDCAHQDPDPESHEGV